MDKPLVSICCITYNHAPFIRECLEGFLMQKTNFPIEILIHDDASTDGTADIIREYEAKHPDIIKPIYQTVNQYSQGKDVCLFNFNRAQGKYIALCEGDDYWTDSQKLQIQFDYMEAHPECSICFHQADIILDNEIKKDNSQPDVECDFTFSHAIPFHTCTLFFRNIDHCASIIKTLGAGRGKLKGGDIVICGRMLELGKMHYSPQVMSLYRIHRGGVTQNQQWKNDTIGWLEHWLAFYQLVPAGRPVAKTQIEWLLKDEFVYMLKLNKNLFPSMLRVMNKNLGFAKMMNILLAALLSLVWNTILACCGIRKKRIC